MKLCVIVVTFNSASTLRACLQSLRGQADGIEIVAVDCASSDESVTLAKKFAEVRVIELNENLGFARANNAGIRATTGEWVWLLNPDAEAKPGALRALLDFATLHERLGAVGPKLLNSDGSLQPSGRRFPTLWRWLKEATGAHAWASENPYRESNRNYDQPCEVDEISGAAFLLRRRALDEVGLLDERFFLNYEDVDLCKRLRAAGWSVWYCPRAEVVHHFGVSRRQVNDLVRRATMRSAEWYFRKHHGVAACLVVKMVNLLRRMVKP